jgi:membrane protein
MNTAISPTVIASPALPRAAFSLSASWAVLRQAATQFIDRRCLSASAAVAFYSAFALAPTLVVLLALASAFFGRDAAAGQLFAQLGAVMGATTALALQEMVKNAWHADDTWIKTTIAVSAIVVGASAIFAQLKESLNEALAPEVPMQDKSEQRRRWYAPLQIRLLAVAATVGVAFLFVAFLIADTALSATMDWLWPDDTGPKVVAWMVTQTFSTLFLALLFAWLLRVLPDVRLSRRAIMRGSLMGAILFNIGKHLFGLYLAKAGTADAFGAAGSLAVLLMWLYFSSLVFMFSAQVARAVDQLKAAQTGNDPALQPKPVSG